MNLSLLTMLSDRRPVLLSYAFDAAVAERPSEDAPPTAFRLFRAGENRFDADGDEGRLVFSERAAALLLDEQAARNRPYVFDYNHLSLLSENPEAGRAAGWHRLEVRDSPEGPELWAVDCEWTEPVAKAMSAKVPEWRFFSPAFHLDPETLEVVSYTNCAITNNPRTHDLPMLASLRAHNRQHLAAEARRPMDPKAALMVLQDPNATPEDRAAALAVLAALVDSSAPAAPPPPASEPAMNAEPPADDDPAKVASIALAKSSVELARRVEALEVRELLATAKIPAEVKAWASSQPVAVVRSFLANVRSPRPEPTAERPTSPTVVEPAQGTGFVAPPMGESPVDKVLGIRAQTTTRLGVSAPKDGVRTITVLSPSQLRARKAGG